MGGDSWLQLKRVVVKEIEGFEKVCMQFQFKQPEKGKEVDTIIFVKQTEIFELNFMTEEIKSIYRFKKPFSRQPEFFQMDDN